MNENVAVTGSTAYMQLVANSWWTKETRNCQNGDALAQQQATAP